MSIDCHEADEEEKKKVIWLQKWWKNRNCSAEWQFNCYTCNAYSVELLGIAKRWVKGIGMNKVNQPSVIAAYNQRIGGVYLFDCALSDLRDL